jgi:hypothetical protein
MPVPFTVKPLLDVAPSVPVQSIVIDCVMAAPPKSPASRQLT